MVLLWAKAAWTDVPFASRLRMSDSSACTVRCRARMWPLNQMIAPLRLAQSLCSCTARLEGTMDEVQASSRTSATPLDSLASSWNERGPSFAANALAMGTGPACRNSTHGRTARTGTAEHGISDIPVVGFRGGCVLQRCCHQSDARRQMSKSDASETELASSTGTKMPHFRPALIGASATRKDILPRSTTQTVSYAGTTIRALLVDHPEGPIRALCILPKEFDIHAADEPHNVQV